MNVLLINAANSHDSIKLVFNADCVELDKNAPTLTVRFADSSQEVLSPEFIIGADGVHSSVRQKLQKGEMSDYHQEFFGWVYKEFNLSKAQAKSAGLALDGGHVWPRGDSLLLGLPNSNGTLTCNLIVPREGHYSFSNLDRETALSALILENFKELAPFVSSICKVTASKTWSGVVTMKTRPWSYRDKVVLVGDAAHAVVHFYAQGLNAALEDCATLVELIEQHPLDRLAAFSKYETIRRVNTDLLAELSKSNFVTLSAQAGKPFYEARVRLETKLATYFPQFWRTPYSMIVHSAMPYVQAMRIARRQDRLWNVLGMPLFQLALGALILLQRRFYRIKARSKSSLGVSSILTERKI